MGRQKKSSTISLQTSYIAILLKATAEYDVNLMNVNQEYENIGQKG